PRLIVFDLDFTLWDTGGVWIDCTAPPFRQDADGTVYDSQERRFQLYPDVLEILESISTTMPGTKIGIASRTSQPGWVREVLEMMEVTHYFDFNAIYPGSKIAHFEQLKRETGFEYAEMVFFDDEPRNIHEVSGLGVNAIEVPSGLNWQVFERGASAFQAPRKNPAR
ncbi:UNVERIFIED_CONTAM: hypothetical protein GTU68_019739, partial [Idotea baltica]|nr:hypothetical protein [Idotea baltica]